jgi:monovalent cation/hydrogen antiporter
MLAVAGVVVAFIPGAPSIRIDPETALPLLIAPILLDAAYDFPVVAASALWRPLAVLVTAVVVAVIGWWAAGLPVVAALVLGAIVAPPDAAAAVAVLGTESLSAAPSACSRAKACSTTRWRCCCSAAR